MAKTAILVDGGFYRKRAAHLWGKKTAEERAKELNAYCMAHLHDKDGNEERQLYRIFYYDCEPVGRRSVYHPLTKKNVDLDKSDTYTWTQTFLEELRKRRKFALRLGTLSNQMAYNLRPDVTRKLLAGTKQLEELTEDDFVFVAQQKGVDMRVGVDIASLAYKKQVDQIVLIAGDADFVPAAKLARLQTGSGGHSAQQPGPQEPNQHRWPASSPRCHGGTTTGATRLRRPAHRRR